MTTIALPRPSQHPLAAWLSVLVALAIAGLTVGLVLTFGGSGSSSAGTSSGTGVTTGGQYYTGHPCPGNVHDLSC